MPERSSREWGARILLSVGVLFLAYVAAKSSLANVIVSSDAHLAYELAPTDGRVLAALASAYVQGSQSAGENGPSVADLAADALRKDPTAVTAADMLAVQAQATSDDQVTRSAFSYSRLLSRRELLPQLWTIEAAVGRGDTALALHNYDLAMRTSEQARQTLFPILADAISERTIRQGLRPILASSPSWREKFLEHIPWNSRHPEAVAALFREISKLDLSISQAAKAQVVNALVSDSQIDEAWDFYLTLHPAARRDRSQDPNFQIDMEAATPFDWKVYSDKMISAVILPYEGRGALDFSVPIGRRAKIVRQLLLLPAGTYTVEGMARNIDLPDRSRPYWSLSCGNGAEIGRIEVPNSGDNGGVIAGVVTVPQDCSSQTLSLNVRPSDNVSGVRGQILALQVSPASR